MHFGQIQFDDHQHEKAYLDYSRVVAVPENLVWLALCLRLAARLGNTTLLTKGSLPPEIDSQVGNRVTKGFSTFHIFSISFQQKKTGKNSNRYY